jgi:hypothetical protein
MAELPSSDVETVWNDREFLLSRTAYTGAFCPFLVLAPAGDQPAPASIARLESAYGFRNELDPDWAARELGLFLRIPAKLLLLIHQPSRGATKRRRPGCEGC